MANSKNTIQNIPLEGELCMNSLKTEVKPFAGYNEKNTTFYGGTLSPIYDKTTEMFDKNNSYTFFNSKGVPYTLVLESMGASGYDVVLYKNNERVANSAIAHFNKTEKLDVPHNTVLAARYWDHNQMERTFYITNNSSYFGIYSGDGHQWIYQSEIKDVGNCQCWVNNGYIICIMNGISDFRVEYIDTNNEEILSGNVIRKTFDTHLGRCPFITGVIDPINPEIFKISLIPDNYFIEDTGIITGETYEAGITAYNVNINLSDKSMELIESNDVYIERIDTNAPLYKITLNQDLTSINKSVYSLILQQFSWRKIFKERDLPVRYSVAQNVDVHTITGNTGINGYDVGCPLGQHDYTSVYYQNGSLISIGYNGLPIDDCLSYDSNIITRATNNSYYNNRTCISYKKNDGYWYCFSSYIIRVSTTVAPDLLKTLVFDNRYVLFKGAGYVQIYDVEEDLIRPERHLDWILSSPPRSYDQVKPWTLTSVVYGGGVNAGYMINKSPFVGYLPNPTVLTDFPVSKKIEWSEYNFLDQQGTIQKYCSQGDTVQSAKYFGKDLQYKDTIYPIDPNGNVVLPISSNAQLIKGYSNNDLVKEGNTVYPLMYYNNTQKTYTYMLLSGMENITNAFSLQGQQYTVDDDNIYAVSFNAGVIQNATAVAYKKNLTFLGALPTQAVFWSDFNKTFYAFTGDRILSRMFEASDINKIEYVGQNPATLSLWICTDDGIYVLSDKDMFKLDYNSKQVAFYSKNALIVTEGATNNECHTISLYLNDDEQGEMIPVKLQTAYYGLGSEQKAVMDCWYLRLFDKDRTEGYVKVKVNTITDVTRHTEEKTFKVNPSDYDDNNIFYLRYQPKYQECVAMQLELETNLGIYSMSLGVNTTDSTAQVSKFNF